jgi:acetate kinase
MKVLVVNAGSSSIKYQVFNMDDESVLAKGLVDRVGIPVLLWSTNRLVKMMLLSKKICLTTLKA